MTNPASDHGNRDVQVRRIILIEGTVNMAVVAAKAVVGTSTGSFAILADAIHSLADLSNNLVAWFVVRLSQAPPDREHPYGHRKYEVLAVFGLAALLTVLAIEIALGAARRDSTIAVMAGWQVSIRGYPWLDTVGAFVVAGFVLYLAWGLFKKAVPVLVDEIAIEPEGISRAVVSVRGVQAVSRVRSRWVGSIGAVDLVVSVDPDLSTVASHEISDAVEDAVSAQFGIYDITVHIEPGIKYD